MAQQKGIAARVVSFIRRKASMQYRFDEQFAAGKWDGLNDVGELGRYSIITGYTRHYHHPARILDLGCGEGILVQRYAPTDFTEYVGVDFSEVAITKAQQKHIKHASFMVADLNQLIISGTYDVIVYNESLYYLKDPEACIARLLPHLAAGGVFIISMVDKHGAEEPLFARLNTILKPLDRTHITNALGHAWTVMVYQAV